MSFRGFVTPSVTSWGAIRRAGICRWLSTSSVKPPRVHRVSKVKSVRVGDVMITMDNQNVSTTAVHDDLTIREKVEDIERAQNIAKEFTETVANEKALSKLPRSRITRPSKIASSTENQEKLQTLQRMNEEAGDVPMNYAGTKTKAVATIPKKRINKKNDRYALLMHLQYVHADSLHDKTDLLPDTQTFIAVYKYLKSFGLTDEELVQMAHRHYRIFRLSVEYNLALKVQYFRSLGCDHDAIQHAFKTHPQIFSLTLRHLGEKTQLLLNLNIPTSSIPQVICHPWVMIRSATLLGRLQLCKAVGCTPEDITKLLLIRSPLLTYSTHTVRLGVMFLLKQGYPIERIPALLLTTPGVIIVKRETLYRASRSFELLLGMPIEQFYSHFLVRYPILSYLKPKNIFGMFTLLASLGCGVEDIRQFLRHQATFLSSDLRAVSSRLEYLASELNVPLTLPLDVARYQRVSQKAMPLFELMHLKYGPRYNVIIYRGGVPVVSNQILSMADPKSVENEKRRLSIYLENLPDVASAINFQATRLLLENKVVEGSQEGSQLLPCGPLDMSQVRVLSGKPTRKPFSLMDTFLSKQSRAAIIGAKGLTDEQYQLEFGHAALEGDDLVRSITSSNRNRLQSVLSRIEATDFDSILDDAIHVNDSLMGIDVDSNMYDFLDPLASTTFDIDAKDLEDVHVEKEGDEEPYDLVGGNIVFRGTTDTVTVDLRTEPVDQSFLSDKNQLDREFPWVESRHRQLSPEEKATQEEKYNKTSQVLSEIMKPREDEFPRSEMEMLAKYVMKADFSSTLVAEDNLSALDNEFFKLNSGLGKVKALNAYSKSKKDEEPIENTFEEEENQRTPAPVLTNVESELGPEIYKKLTNQAEIDKYAAKASNMSEKHQQMLAQLQAKKMALLEMKKTKADAALLKLKLHAAHKLGRVGDAITLDEKIASKNTTLASLTTIPVVAAIDSDLKRQSIMFSTDTHAVLGDALSSSIPQGSRLALLRKIQLCDEAMTALNTKIESLRKILATEKLTVHKTTIMETEISHLLKLEEFFQRHRNLNSMLPSYLFRIAKRYIPEETITAFEVSSARDTVAPLISLAYTKSSIFMLDEELNIMPKISLVHAMSSIWTSMLSKLTGVELYNQNRLQLLRSYTVQKDSSLAYCLEGSLSASSSFYSFLNGSPGMPHTVALSAIYKSPAVIYNSFNVRILPRMAITALRTMGHRLDSQVLQIEAYEKGVMPNPIELKNLQGKFAQGVQQTRFQNPFVILSPREAELCGYNHDQVIFEPADASAPEGSAESKDRYSVILAGYVPGSDVMKKQHHYLKKKGNVKREGWGNNTAEHPYFDPYFHGLDKSWPETYGEYVRLLEDAREEYARVHPGAEPQTIEQPAWLDDIQGISSYKADSDDIDEELVDTLESIHSEITETTTTVGSITRKMQAHRRVVFKYTLEFPELLMPALATFNFMPQMKPTIDSKRIYTTGPIRPNHQEAFDIPRVPVNHPLPEHVPEAKQFQATRPFRDPLFVEQNQGDTFFDEFVDLPFITSASHNAFFEDRLVNPDLFIPMQRDLRMVTALLERARRRQRFGAEKGLEPLFVLGKSPRSHLSKEFFYENKIL